MNRPIAILPSPIKAVCLYVLDSDRAPSNNPGLAQSGAMLVWARSDTDKLALASDNFELLVYAPAAALIRSGLARLVYAGDSAAFQSCSSEVTELHSPFYHLPEGAPISAPMFRPGGRNGKLTNSVMYKGTLDDIRFGAAMGDRVRMCSGHDRVVMHRVNRDWNGEVRVMSASPELFEAYLSHSAPASDIPCPAREMFVRNGFSPVIAVLSKPGRA